MKRVLVTIFSALFIIGSIPNVGVYIWFKMDQKNIVTNHCVQRKKKNNTCQGKCFLKKKIKETRNQRPVQNIPIEQTEESVNLYVVDIENLFKMYNSAYFSDFRPQGVTHHVGRQYKFKLLRPPQ